MAKLHLHLLSDSTGETLDMMAKAALAQFDGVETMKHFWPMVRSEGHLQRIMGDIGKNPGLVLFTLANNNLRRKLEDMCAAAGLPALAPLDAVTDTLSSMLGQQMTIRQQVKVEPRHARPCAQLAGKAQRQRSGRNRRGYRPPMSDYPSPDSCTAASFTDATVDNGSESSRIVGRLRIVPGQTVGRIPNSA